MITDSEIWDKDFVVAEIYLQNGEWGYAVFDSASENKHRLNHWRTENESVYCDSFRIKDRRYFAFLCSEPKLKSLTVKILGKTPGEETTEKLKMSGNVIYTKVPDFISEEDFESTSAVIDFRFYDESGKAYAPRR